LKKARCTPITCCRSSPWQRCSPVVTRCPCMSLLQPRAHSRRRATHNQSSCNSFAEVVSQGYLPQIIRRLARRTTRCHRRWCFAVPKDRRSPRDRLHIALQPPSPPFLLLFGRRFRRAKFFHKIRQKRQNNPSEAPPLRRGSRRLSCLLVVICVSMVKILFYRHVRQLRQSHFCSSSVQAIFFARQITIAGRSFVLCPGRGTHSPKLSPSPHRLVVSVTTLRALSDSHPP